MDREYLFCILALIVIGPLVAIGSCLAWLRGVPRDDEPNTSALFIEANAARRLLAPLVPAALGLSLLLGWFVQEPPQAEGLPWQALAIAALPGVVLLRAMVRAFIALLSRHGGPAVTVGFIKRRVVLDPEFVASLNDDERDAVIAHELAHAVHHDPLRLFVAQFLSDLQWPVPGAAERLHHFRQALELARDEEARARVEGTALATAVLRAARCVSGRHFATAAIVTSDSLLRTRVERLLAPVPRFVHTPAPRLLGFAVLAAALVASFSVGVFFGEGALRAVLGFVQ